MPPNLDPMINTMASSGDAYKIPNLKLIYARRNVRVPIGIWRSTMLSQHGFFAESFVDEMAHAAGQDPLAFRQALVTGNPAGESVMAALSKMGDFSHSGGNRAWGVAVAAGWNCVCAAAMNVSIEKNKGLRIHDVACALHCGTIINPAIVTSQVQSAFLYGLCAALWGEITIRDGQVVQGNFDTQPVLRMNQAPAVRVSLVPSDAAPGGVGEIATGVAAPALANAIFAAGGARLRALPVKRSGYALVT
jgi:isoquinoline 1-oxidoreductase beta subunit